MLYRSLPQNSLALFLSQTKNCIFSSSQAINKYFAQYPYSFTLSAVYIWLRPRLSHISVNLVYLVCKLEVEVSIFAKLVNLGFGFVGYNFWVFIVLSISLNFTIPFLCMNQLKILGAGIKFLCNLVISGCH